MVPGAICAPSPSLFNIDSGFIQWQCENYASATYEIVILACASAGVVIYVVPPQAS